MNGHSMDPIKPCRECHDPVGCHIPGKIDTNSLSLGEFWDLHAEWSRTTFGSDAERGPAGPLAHMAKEIAEVQANPKDLMEYADLLLLLFDACRRAGFNFHQLRRAACEKLKINKARKWGKPNADGSVEHVREPVRIDPNVLF